MPSDTYSLYIHIPFCRRRCSYCDFNTSVGQGSLIPAYFDALRREIRAVSRSAPQRLPVDTIYFGGGTPTVAPVKEIATLLQYITECFDLASDAEITIEANPGTVSASTFMQLQRAGINRISFGMQTAHPTELEMLERLHSYPNVLQAFIRARRAGFDNLSLDLIYGLPGQTLERWRQTIELALKFQPVHLSLYALTLEPGTPLHARVENGLLPPPDDDLSADMYEWACERLSINRFLHYEISNWALGKERICRHNMQYWRNHPYLGLGAGAHGFATGRRLANESDTLRYIQRCHNPVSGSFPLSPATAQKTIVSKTDEMGETLMVGLRLVQEGVSSRDFEKRFGQTLDSVFGDRITRLCQLGLLEWSLPAQHRRLRLTPRGRLLGNQVFMEFI
jgi:oxygen-independent coproporphyrinogen III oxidase